jgi:hypothetical protein
MAVVPNMMAPQAILSVPPPMNQIDMSSSGGLLPGTPGTKTIQMSAVPVAIVDARGTPTGQMATLMTPQNIIGAPQVQQVIPDSIPFDPSALQGVPTLSSDEDIFVPFENQRVVSKYGPISRVMGTITTPSVMGSTNDIHHTNGGTHSTNVMIGRACVPSLTYIQPMQQLVLVADPTGHLQQCTPPGALPMQYQDQLQMNGDGNVHEMAPQQVN